MNYIVCDSLDCGNRAVAKAFWPGKEKPINVCPTCVNRVRTIGYHLGCPVVVEALPGFMEIELPTEVKDEI